MLILLPPSEGKSVVVSGVGVDFGELSFPGLTSAREAVVDELVRVSASVDAAEVLKVGRTLSAEVERNVRVLVEPAGPAWRVYSGVLFEALDVASLSEVERARAFGSVVVVSALWGALRLDDVIPAYRLSMGVRLPELGNLARFWRSELAEVLDPLAEGELVVDCRSAAYGMAWQSPAARTYAVRVVREDDGGARKVVSHFAKHYRGLLARYVITEDLCGVNDIEVLVERLRERWQVEVTPATAKKAGVLTLVLPTVS